MTIIYSYNELFHDNLINSVFISVYLSVPIQVKCVMQITNQIFRKYF